MRRAGATLHRGARASHCRGLSCCGAQAPDAQAQELWLTGPAAPRHVGSSQTRARTRQTLKHCTAREAPHLSIFDGGIAVPQAGSKEIHVLFMYGSAILCKWLPRFPCLPSVQGKEKECGDYRMRRFTEAISHSFSIG